MEKAKEYGIRRAVIYSEKYCSNPKYDLNRQIIKEDKNFAIVVDPLDLNLNVEILFGISSGIVSGQSDLFENSIESIDSVFKIKINNKLVLTKDNVDFVVVFSQDVLKPICELMEYFLNRNLYFATIHNNIGFIKCFSDQGKKNYLMAVKIAEISNEQEKQRFLSFFDSTS